ncbi:hypothetical protein MASR1M12_17310 [Erysipelotrichia bacterium]
MSGFISALAGSRFFYPGFLWLLILLTFWSVAGFEYLSFDEDQVILKNPLITAPLGFEGLVDIFTSLATNQYSPLSVLSFWVEYNLFGFNSSISHLINLLLHLICATAVYLLAAEIIGQKSVAWLVAAGWALHPIQVETVAWVLERRNLMHALFYFASMLAYVRFQRSGSPSHMRIAVAMMLLSGLAKTLAFIQPLSWLILDFLEKRPLTKDLVKEKFPALLLALALFLTTFLAAQQEFQPGDKSSLNFMAAAGSVVFYSEKTFLPKGLSATYELNRLDSGTEGISLTAVFLLFMVFAIVGWRNRAATAGILFFLVHLSPMSGLVRVGYNFYAALHFMYVPLFGLVGATVALVAQAGRSTGKAAVFRSAGFLLVLLLAILSFQHSQIWKNTGTLFEHSLQLDPVNRFARNQLAVFYETAGRNDEASGHFKKLIDEYPDFFGGYYGLARIYAVQGQTDKALEMFTQAVRLNDGRGGILNDYGRLLLRLRRYREAEEAFLKSLEMEPGRTALLLRAEARRNRGNYPGAIADLTMLIYNQPGNLSYRLARIETLFEAGNWPAVFLDLHALLFAVTRLSPCPEDDFDFITKHFAGRWHLLLPYSSAVTYFLG